jgi:hypothetical protein
VESSKIARQALKDENLLMTGMVLAIMGFYAIAEWEVFVGLCIVCSSYVIIITSTKIGKQSLQFFISKTKVISKIFNRDQKS